MGQHKFNETAKLAKEGLLPPKRERLSNAELTRRFQGEMMNVLQNDRKLAPLFLAYNLSKNKGY